MAVNIVIMGALGRMGQAIRAAAGQYPDISLAGQVESPDRLAADQTKFDVPTAASLAEVLQQSGRAVIIDFTTPTVSLDTARTAAKFGCPVVCGTTGLNDEQKDELAKLAQNIPYLLAPNMSVGINVLLMVLPQLVRALGPAYNLEIVEIHHNRKKDAPSGTALKLAECLAEARQVELEEVAAYCRHGLIGERTSAEIGLQTVRGGDVVGVHTVYMLGPGERLEITHQAHSRDTFAQGALRAAVWLNGQQPERLYSMRDVLEKG